MKPLFRACANGLWGGEMGPEACGLVYLLSLVDFAPDMASLFSWGAGKHGQTGHGLTTVRLILLFRFTRECRISDVILTDYFCVSLKFVAPQQNSALAVCAYASSFLRINHGPRK